MFLACFAFLATSAVSCAASYFAQAIPCALDCKIDLVRADITHPSDPWVQDENNYSLATVMVTNNDDSWYQVEWENMRCGGELALICTYQYWTPETQETEAFGLAVPDSAGYKVWCNTVSNKWEAQVADETHTTKWEINWETKRASWFGEVISDEGVGFLTRMVGTGGNVPDSATKFTMCRYSLEDDVTLKNASFTSTYTSPFTNFAATKDSANSFHIWDWSPLTLVLNPAEGPAAGDTDVVLTGQGFIDENPKVNIGGVEVNAVYVSKSRIMFTTPPHAAGKVDVWVKDDYNPKGWVNTDAFEYK